VSRRHAELQWIDGDIHVVDLHSANGTTVDGQRLHCSASGPSEPQSLRAGSKLKFGTLEAEVVRDDR
jgi:pSer/pThr/pTyr-binding forkhead associated (FHA) protein